MSSMVGSDEFREGIDAFRERIDELLEVIDPFRESSGGTAGSHPRVRLEEVGLIAPLLPLFPDDIDVRIRLRRVSHSVGGADGARTRDLRRDRPEC